jgi:long-subunit fatty acid transport protein
LNCSMTPPDFFSRTGTLFFVLIGVAAILLVPRTGQAVFVENMAGSTKAISLANTVTAAPPGLMSIHSNPAGLSQLPEGKIFEQGVTLPWLQITKKYKEDKDWEGIFGQWGPQEGQEHDPVAGRDDVNKCGVMYIPILNRTANFLIAPTAGLSSRKPGSKWTFAIANYAPYGGGMDHHTGSPNSYGVKKLYIQHLIYAAPAVSYQVTPTLALGLAVGAGQTALGAEIHQRTPNELVALTRVLGDATKDLEIPIVSELTLPPPWFGGGIGPYDHSMNFNLHLRDDFSPNYNLGLLWTPKKWFSFGMVYQSEIKARLSGGYNFIYGDAFQRQVAWQGSSPVLIITAAMLDLPTNAVPYQSGDMRTTQIFPQRIQTGIKLKPTKKLSLLFDVHWADWSTTKYNAFHVDQDIQALQFVKLLGYTHGNRTLYVERDMKDTIHWSAGLEYQLTNKLALRCGYEFRPTSIRQHLYDQQYFVPDLTYLGVGASVKLPHQTTLDLAFGYIHDSSQRVPNNSSTNLNATDFWYPVYNPYSGLDYEQETRIYIASFTVQMPFHVFVEQQKHIMHKQHEAIHHLVGAVKKLLGKAEAAEEAH